MEQDYIVTSDALGGLPEVEVTADTFEDAAEAAMEAWDSGGTFAGVDIYGPYGLLVVEKATGRMANVMVNVEWEPVYTAFEAEEHDG
jgi:hypothetical protein